MADSKLTALTENTTPSKDDLIYLVDNPGGSPISKKVTMANLVGGWIGVADTWTYVNAFQVTIPAGGTSFYSVGDKIRLTQTTVKYFSVVAVADTLLTITAGTSYTLANAAISAVAYSKATNPVGWPEWFNFTSTVSGSTGSAGTYAETVYQSRFSVSGRTCKVVISKIITNLGSWTGSVLVQKPVTTTNSTNVLMHGMVIDGGTITPRGYIIGTNDGSFNFHSAWGTAALGWAALATSDWVLIDCFYEI